MHSLAHYHSERNHQRGGETATSRGPIKLLLLLSIGGVRHLVRVINRSILIVLPMRPFLDWLHGADPTSADLTLEDLRREPAVYLLPARDLETDLEKELKRFCKTIFEEQLNGWYRVEESWPRDKSIVAFREWFEYRFYGMPIDLSKEPLDWDEL